jgi:predicted nucleotidyltransferase
VGVERRRVAVSELMGALSRACPGSDVHLRGSLATEDADPYSDIDLIWIVPDERFEAAVERTSDALAEVGPVLLQRSDPKLQLSTKRRLLFVNFEQLPLFWRVDIDVRARSIAEDDRFDDGNPGARGDQWSLPASALANAVGAVKAVRRNQPGEARGLLERAYERLRLGSPPANWQDAVIDLARQASAREPQLASLSERVEHLGQTALNGGMNECQSFQ